MSTSPMDFSPRLTSLATPNHGARPVSMAAAIPPSLLSSSDVASPTLSQSSTSQGPVPRPQPGAGIGIDSFHPPPPLQMRLQGNGDGHGLQRSPAAPRPVSAYSEVMTAADRQASGAGAAAGGGISISALKRGFRSISPRLNTRDVGASSSSGEPPSRSPLSARPHSAGPASANSYLSASLSPGSTSRLSPRSPISGADDVSDDLDAAESYEGATSAAAAFAAASDPRSEDAQDHGAEARHGKGGSGGGRNGDTPTLDVPSRRRPHANRLSMMDFLASSRGPDLRAPSETPPPPTAPPKSAGVERSRRSVAHESSAAPSRGGTSGVAASLPAGPPPLPPAKGRLQPREAAATPSTAGAAAMSDLLDFLNDAPPHAAPRVRNGTSRGEALGGKGKEVAVRTELPPGPPESGRPRAEPPPQQPPRRAEDPLSLSVRPVQERINMFGSTHTSAHYSISGRAVLTVRPALLLQTFADRARAKAEAAAAAAAAATAAAAAKEPPRSSQLASGADGVPELLALPAEIGESPFAQLRDFQGGDDDVAGASGSAEGAASRASSAAAAATRGVLESPRAPTELHVKSMRVSFKGYALYVDPAGRFSALRLTEASEELLPSGCKIPLEAALAPPPPPPPPSSSRASASSALPQSDATETLGGERLRDAPVQQQAQSERQQQPRQGQREEAVHYEADFDVTVPGWVPASMHSRFGFTFYCLSAEATFSEPEGTEALVSLDAASSLRDRSGLQAVDAGPAPPSQPRSSSSWRMTPSASTPRMSSAPASEVAPTAGGRQSSLPLPHARPPIPAAVPSNAADVPEEDQGASVVRQGSRSASGPARMAGAATAGGGGTGSGSAVANGAPSADARRNATGGSGAGRSWLGKRARQLQLRAKASISPVPSAPASPLDGNGSAPTMGGVAGFGAGPSGSGGGGGSSSGGHLAVGSSVSAAPAKLVWRRPRRSGGLKLDPNERGDYTVRSELLPILVRRCREVVPVPVARMALVSPEQRARSPHGFAAAQRPAPGISTPTPQPPTTPTPTWQAAPPVPSAGNGRSGSRSLLSGPSVPAESVPGAVVHAAAQRATPSPSPIPEPGPRDEVFDISASAPPPDGHAHPTPRTQPTSHRRNEPPPPAILPVAPSSLNAPSDPAKLAAMTSRPPDQARHVPSGNGGGGEGERPRPSPDLASHPSVPMRHFLHRPVLHPPTDSGVHDDDGQGLPFSLTLSVPSYVQIDAPGAEVLSFGIQIEVGRSSGWAKVQDLGGLRLRDMELICEQSERHTSVPSRTFRHNFPIAPDPMLAPSELPIIDTERNEMRIASLASQSAPAQELQLQRGYDHALVAHHVALVRAGKAPGPGEHSVERYRVVVVGPPPHSASSGKHDAASGHHGGTDGSKAKARSSGGNAPSGAGEAPGEEGSSASRGQGKGKGKQREEREQASEAEANASGVAAAAGSSPSSSRPPEMSQSPNAPYSAASLATQAPGQAQLSDIEAHAPVSRGRRDGRNTPQPAQVGSAPPALGAQSVDSAFRSARPTSTVLAAGAPSGSSGGGTSARATELEGAPSHSREPTEQTEPRKKQSRMGRAMQMARRGLSEFANVLAEMSLEDHMLDPSSDRGAPFGETSGGRGVGGSGGGSGGAGAAGSRGGRHADGDYLTQDPDAPRASYTFKGDDGHGVDLTRGRVRMTVNLPLTSASSTVCRRMVWPLLVSDYESPYLRVKHKLKVKLGFGFGNKPLGGEGLWGQALVMCVPVRFTDAPPREVKQQFAPQPLAAIERGLQPPTIVSGEGAGPPVLPAYTQLFNEDGSRLADEGEDLPQYPGPSRPLLPHRGSVTAPSPRADGAIHAVASSGSIDSTTSESHAARETFVPFTPGTAPSSTFGGPTASTVTTAPPNPTEAASMHGVTDGGASATPENSPSASPKTTATTAAGAAPPTLNRIAPSRVVDEVLTSAQAPERERAVREQAREMAELHADEAEEIRIVTTLTAAAATAESSSPSSPADAGAPNLDEAAMRAAGPGPTTADVTETAVSASVSSAASASASASAAHLTQTPPRPLARVSSSLSSSSTLPTLAPLHASMRRPSAAELVEGLNERTDETVEVDGMDFGDDDDGDDGPGGVGSGAGRVARRDAAAGTGDGAGGVDRRQAKAAQAGVEDADGGEASASYGPVAGSSALTKGATLSASTPPVLPRKASRVAIDFGNAAPAAPTLVVSGAVEGVGRDARASGAPHDAAEDAGESTASQGGFVVSVGGSGAAAADLAEEQDVRAARREDALGGEATPKRLPDEEG